MKSPMIYWDKWVIEAVAEAAVGEGDGAELTVHLGYGKHDPAGKNSGNSRNGTGAKTLKGEFGQSGTGYAAGSQRDV